ncbi:cysteine hydrolase family protein [Zymomonas mobilis]|uniref:Isochorismatase hydrolase n=1 Tax=Zymomonas mobilis subsp. mobilis (strain ATCC 10988 / DSM 424 / LMG 404 / NCIMB 8938 / NRRL B-806 / ZM1) TaxID=555217 RepID=A0A0H3G2X4_ZYMMA|nr:cysteine hydrolase family protein [Zymomonas mobilis]AEH63138.1 isochorismatase hydrolase [Zymomonas mobilis subsp. mobilis ATCC 10988]TQL27249.1 nicotinamidase-related amidase [Zymomonas mobilis]TQL28679.1 nicotinamidase-related amidase [Zymomonas mobilis]
MKTALLVVDMQMLMQENIDKGRDYTSDKIKTHIPALLSAFRAAGKPVFHIRHQQDEKMSEIYPQKESYQAMPCAEAIEGETVLYKTTSSAFASTDLTDRLRKAGISHLVIVGAVAAFCVNSTVRAGKDLGFEIVVVKDALLSFDLPTYNLSAQQILDMTTAILAAAFATVVDTKSALTSYI